MATIDILDIQIASSAKKANDAIDNLITKLGKLANSLKIDTSGLEKIGKSLNLSGLEKSTKTIVDAFGNVLSSVDMAEKALKKKTKKITLSLEQMEEKYKGLGKGFTLKGSTQFIQKNIDSLTNQLAKATLAKERFETSGKTNLGGYEKAVAKVIELKNQIESLNNQLETIRTASRAVNIDFKTTGLTEVIKPLQEFEKELQDVQEGVKVTEEVYKGLSNIPKGYFDNNINELEASLKDLKNTYPQATKTISDFEQGLRNLKDISGKLAGEYIKVNVDTSTTDEISNVKNGFEELRIKLSQLEIPPIREDNLEKLQSALEKTEVKLDELNVKLQNEVTMGRVAENVDDKGFVKLEEQIALTEKTAEALRKKIKEVENTTKSTGKQNSIVNKLSNSFKNLSNKAEKSVKPIDNMSKAFKNMARNILPILGIRELFSFGKESIENSMNYLETLNYFNKAFEQVASKADLRSFEEMGYESADAYYKSFSERAKELTSKMTGFEISDKGTLSATGAASLGIDPSKLMNYQAMFAQMSSSMDVASEKSLKLSQALTEIGADLASVRNMDFEKVWQDMASGLAGMSRTWDKYGANIREANLQQKLNEIGINANISALGQSDKVMLRTIILLESAEYAYADLAKTINAPANQLRLLQSNFQNLSRTIGNIFLPIVSKILPYINGLTIALQRLFTFIGELIGLDMDLSSLGGIGSNETADDLLGDLQDNLDNASESAKELKNELLGFDEVTKLSDTLDTENAGAGISSIDSTLLDKAFDEALNKYQETWDKAFADMENGSNIIADKIEKALEPVKKIIEDFAIGDFFSAGEDVSNLVMSITKFITKAIDNINWYDIGQKIGDFINGINWSQIMWDFAKLAATIAKSIGEAFAGLIDTSPIAGGIIAMFATLKLTGLSAAISKNITSTLNKKGLSIGKIATAITLGVASVELANSETLGGHITSVLAAALGGSIVAGLPGALAGLSLSIPLNILFSISDKGNTLTWEEIPLNKAVQNLKNSVEELGEKYSSLQEMLKNKPLNVTAEYSSINGLLDIYFDLSNIDYDKMTEEQKTQLKTLYDKIVEYAPLISEQVDSVTGAWKGTKEELQKAIDNQHTFYLQSAYSDIYSEAIKNLAEYQTKYREIYTNEDYQNLIDEQVKADKELESIRNKLFSKGFSAEDISQLNHGNILLGMDKDLAKEYINAYNSSQKIRKNILTVEKSMEEVSDYFENTKEEAVEIAKQMGISYEELELMKVTDFITFEDFENNIKNAENTYNNAKNQVENNPVEAEVEVDTAEVENAEWTWQDFINQVENNPVEAEVEVDTAEAIDAVNMGVSVMNAGLGLIKTPNINVKTDKATQMVSAAINAMNTTLAHLATPELELKTQKAVVAATNFAEMVKSSLEKISITPTVNKANLGFNIGLGIRKFAAGGFPTSGLSLVGENGPELYGSFNGRPAVAANASITEGIKQAAYEGMKMALAEYQGGGTPVVVTLQGDTKKFFTAMQSEAQNYVATNNLSPFPV